METQTLNCNFIPAKAGIKNDLKFKCWMCSNTAACVENVKATKNHDQARKMIEVLDANSPANITLCEFINAREFGYMPKNSDDLMNGVILDGGFFAALKELNGN